MRIDFIIKNSKPYFLEVNSIPGMSAESIIPKQCKAAGIMLHELFEDLLDQAIIKNS